MHPYAYSKSNPVTLSDPDGLRPEGMTGLEYTRYERVVEAVGGKGYWVDTDAALPEALDAAFASRAPVCVNVKIAPSDFRKGAISV